MKEAMANLAVIASLAIALLFATLQAQGTREAAAGGHGNAAEYVLLEPRPEQLVSTIPAGAAVTAAANTTKPVCGNCRCCLKVKPDVCLTTCCFVKACNGPSCTSQMASCGCNSCDW